MTSRENDLLERLDPLRESSQMGVDIFQEALELVTVKKTKQKTKRLYLTRVT